MSTDANGPVAPLNPDLAGYPTPEALVAGYRNSSEEGKRQRERADKLEGLVTQLISAQTGSNSRSPVPDRGGSAEDRLTALGVPVDALEEYVGDRISKAFQPIANGMQARGRMVAERPDYIQFENEVARFIETDPDLNQRYPKMFEADPAGAMEYAFLKFGDSRRREAPAPMETVGNPVDASIPSSRGGESRRVPDQSQELQSAFERYQKTGSPRDAEAYAKLRLRRVVSDDFLNQ